MSEIGFNLRRIRKRSGLTQTELARLAGLSRVGYRKIETGVADPRSSTLLALATALDCNLSELFLPSPPLLNARFCPPGCVR